MLRISKSRARRKRSFQAVPVPMMMRRRRSGGRRKKSSREAPRRSIILVAPRRRTYVGFDKKDEALRRCC